MPKPAAPPLPAKRSRSSSRSVAGTESKRTNNDKDGATSKKAQKHSMDSDDEGVDGGLPFKKKTKSDNRHRFESFSDKIKQVKVNVANRFVKNYTDSPEGGESFFVESLPLWRDLNLTPEFTRYLRESSRYTQSLQQILYHKQLIVDQLVSFLEVPNTPALEPLLNLVTLLARDLQEEFFPYFFRVMETVTKLLKPESDPKRIEWIFNTLTYLFKYLAVQVTKEANETFQ
ncbi:hypothetical protein DFJ73DRAFT_163560 [Zopfochytrium polystomum]|nr:hypothetical protein DFJ73DRAFT_163560 [Zopfochytrium polystomum]